MTERGVRFESEPGIPCPLCHQSAGREDRVAGREGDKFRVIVRCERCRHRWTMILPASEPGGPKATG